MKEEFEKSIEEAIHYINSIPKEVAAYVAQILHWKEEDKSAFLFAYKILNEQSEENEHEHLARQRNRKPKKRNENEAK